MSRNKQIAILFFALLLSLKGLIAQTIEFTPGDESTSYLKYNIAMSTANTAAGVGGFTGGSGRGNSWTFH